MPSSLYEAKKSLSTLGMKYEKIHACPKDCILYRNEHANLMNCPTCGSSRWKVVKKGKIYGGVPTKEEKICEGVSAKVLWYFPPIPRFQRMFRIKDMSNNLTWHAHKRVCDGYLRHPADAPAWKLVDEKWPDFANDPRNLRLALSADGINPHSLQSSNYSCWPIILITYNLPPWLCMKRRHMMLTLLVSGPRQPGNDIDVYLEPLIDDLKKLWEHGVETYDAYHEDIFMLRAVLLWTINDFPAYGNLSGNKVKGYFACPICADQTYARRLKHSRKMSFTGHRRFLPDSHPYRRQKRAFNGRNELRPAPKILSGIEVFERVEGLQCVWGKKSKNQLVFVPCNVGFHWILMVVDPHKEKVYVLDSLSNNYHFDEWKSIMEMAMKMFNMSIGKRGRQSILWEVIKCQQQPDEKQCGFYVMRYMRDIIENHDSLPIPLLFTEGFYSKREIDEVRTEWCGVVQDFID